MKERVQIKESFALFNDDHDSHLNFVFFLKYHTLLYTNVRVNINEMLWDYLSSHAYL